jgi:hydroxypyruvate reductase
VRKHLTACGRPEGPTNGPTLVVGAGKAAARMAAGCEAVLGSQHVRGLVIVPDDCALPLASVDVAIASHPMPDRRGLEASAALWRLLAEAPPGLVLCLVSGGASSLLIMPRPPVTLADKIEVNRLLLGSGAEIHEVNTVRKHLSLVKGGGLLRAVRGRRVTTLILSDVVGNDPSTVGSGPTIPDPTTFADALAVLERRGISGQVAPTVRELLRRGSQGGEPETVKPGDDEAALVDASVIGSNRTARLAAAAEARRLGYGVTVLDEPVVGDTTAAARGWLASLRRAGPHCSIAGGETTVELRGSGRGGRNQEFALALVEPLAGSPFAVLSVGTDGIDGPTDAAGAFVDGASLERARRLGLDPAAALRDNDSYRFFDRLGDLLRCGPTGTNVMDLKLAIDLTSAT